MATLYPRTTKDGRTRWTAGVRVRGYPAEYKTFSTKTRARQWAEKRQIELREGRYLLRRESERRTLRELIETYLRDVAPHGRSERNLAKKAARLRWWLDEIGDYRLSDVTSSLISQCKRRLLADELPTGRHRKGATVNRYLADLSRAFTIAVRELEWVDSNPVRRVERFPESRGRTRFLDEEERIRLLTACRESSSRHLYGAVAVALGTGGRHGEVLGLRWRDVNLRPGEAAVTFRDTKNGETRTVALEGLALDALRQAHSLRRLDTDLVFPSRKGDRPASIRNAFDRAVEVAGLEDFRFHDLRHTFASYLAMSGATLAEIADALGHKTLVMVKRYAHLSQQHARSVVERMHRKFLA